MDTFPPLGMVLGAKPTSYLAALLPPEKKLNQEVVEVEAVYATTP
ncbi:MAG: hypothetical protein ACR2JX_01840 [Mycobacteriales bacterium]